MNKALITNIALFTSGALIGSGVGYVFGVRKVKNFYQQEAEKYVEEMREYYDDREAKRRKTGEYESAISARDALIADGGEPPVVNKKVSNYQPGNRPKPESGLSIAEALAKSLENGDVVDPVLERAIRQVAEQGQTEEEPEPEERRVFDEAPVTIDLAMTQLAENRNEEEPYVISVSEFHDDYPEFTRVTLLYFGDADVLVEEDYSPVDLSIVGRDSLDHFGVGSEDADIVYIRNHHLDMHIELIRDKREWANIMHGITDGPGTSA